MVKNVKKIEEFLNKIHGERERERERVYDIRIIFKRKNIKSINHTRYTVIRNITNNLSSLKF